MTIRTKPPFPWLLALTWLVLLGAAVGGFLTGEFSVTFVGAGTFLLTLIPFWLAPRIGLNLPIGFVTAIAVFLCATLFLARWATSTSVTGGGTWCCTAVRPWPSAWSAPC